MGAGVTDVWSHRAGYGVDADSVEKRQSFVREIIRATLRMPGRVLVNQRDQHLLPTYPARGCSNIDGLGCRAARALAVGNRK